MKMPMLILVATLVMPFAAACDKGAPPQSDAPALAASTDPQAKPAPAPELNLPDDPKNIVNIAIGSKDHTTLVAALKAADYVYGVSNPGPLTVFAPTDAAFASLPKGTVEGLLKPEKVDDLRNVLKYHVAPSTYEAKDLKDGMTLGMVNGAKITVHVKDGKTTINDARLVATIRASNGVVHVIDGVLLPPARTAAN